MKIVQTHRYFFCLLLFLPCLISYGQINADFSASATVGCTPFNVQFKDISTGKPTQWVWDFGNGTSSTLQNPAAVYSNAGTYTVRLIVKNATDKNYIEKKNFVTVSATPDAEFSLSTASGCLPLQVNFKNNTNLFGAGIKSWSWDFGDGFISNQQNPAHTYNTLGIYNVTLVAQNTQGCFDSVTVTGAVRTGNKPASVSFKAAPLDGCASVLRKFTDLSTGTVNSWNWDFGDGGTDNTKNPSYHYTDTGWFSVKLVVSDNGCADSVQYKNLVHVVGPIAEIHQTLDCSNPYTVNFYDPLKDAETWNWDFDDGNTSILRNQVHTYGTTGTFDVKLTVSAGACVDSADYIISIADENLSYKTIPAKASYCKGDSIAFVVNKYDSSMILAFAWSFDNGITRTPFFLSNSSIKQVYSPAGNYPSPLLYIQDVEHCFDTIKTAPLIITGPAAGFNNSAPACIGGNIIFSDQSIPYKNSPVKQWKWNFGDGDSVLASSSPVSYAYSFPGLYNILLKVTDADGCTDTISNTINISDTPVIDAGTDTLICAGKSVTLQPGGGAAYMWDNSAYLSCTNCTNPVAAPIDTTVFYVTGKNAAGCASRDSIKINVQQQQNVTIQPATDTICAGNSVQLLASGADSYKWQPINGLDNSNIPNPLATPQNNTVYTVTGTDKPGCFSNTASVNIIAMPKPAVNIIDSKVTVQPGAKYQLLANYSSDVISWQWQPPQWLSDPTTANPVAQPQETITYTVIAGTTTGCFAIDHITISVICNNSVLFVPNTFSPNNDGVNDYFFPRSNTAINIKSLKIFNRWGQEIYKKNDFSTNDQSTGWDGKYKGVMQQSDVYVYLLQVTCSNGSMFRKQGSITLLR